MNRWPYAEITLSVPLAPLSLSACRMAVGNTRTAIICCISPAGSYLEETRSTLAFASRASAIKTSAEVNEVGVSVVGGRGW